jgi:hypothetical protein
VEASAVSKKTKGQETKPRNNENRTKLRLSPTITAARNETTSTAKTTRSSSSSSQQRRRPRLIFHIGPHKTATSALQCKFTHLKETLHKEEASSWEYLGRVYGECFEKPYLRNIVDTRQLVSCLNSHSDQRPCHEQKEWKALEALLKKLAQSHRHVILSDEAFSRLKVTNANLKLLQETLSRYYDVTLVMVYRRYYEWVLSMHNEKYKPLARRVKYLKWPDEKDGKALRTFPDYYRRLKKGQGIGGYQLEAEQHNQHAVGYLKTVFETSFQDIRIFNMHHHPAVTPNEDDLLSLETRFFREIILLPEAAAVSQSLQEKLEQDHGPKRTNPSLSLDYDLLAVAAHEQGLLAPHLQRSQVARAVSLAFSKLSSNYTAHLPRECPTPDEYTAILNRSLTFEERLFSGEEEPSSQVAARRRQMHKADFVKARSKLAFCNIDTNAVLKDPVWQRFFQRLV